MPGGSVVVAMATRQHQHRHEQPLMNIHLPCYHEASIRSLRSITSDLQTLFNMDSRYPLPDTYKHQHKRGKSSVLKTFIHKRSPSAGAVLSSTSPTDVFIASPAYNNYPDMPFLPQDHPHNRVLGELQQNQQSQPPPPPRKSREGKAPDGSFKSLHKKTLSSISLKSLAGRDTDKQSKSKDHKPTKPKKTKSATNLASLLSRPKSSKSLRKQAEEDEARAIKDKENRSPILPPSAELFRPPIYAQFSSERFAKQPSGGKFLEDEIDLYTPEQYSPGKQRNFYGGPGSQPSLARHNDGSQRPKSTYLPSSFSIQDISRRVSGGSSRPSEELSRKSSGEHQPSFEKNKPSQPKSAKATLNRGQRVLSVFGGSKPKVPEAGVDPILEDKNVDREFEAMLDRRNIPEHQRGKMRSLAMSMKKDFVKQDWAEIAAAKNSRPGTNSSDSSADAATGARDAEAKSKRPRSRTFTLSRSSSKDPPSPTKKSRPDITMGRHTRTKSSESINGGGKSLAITGAAVAQTLIAKAKGQMPDDFVSYLRKVQKPELVEVGRLHKLRLLLRNETVAWTDEFIGQGGMEEIVGLLHRTMEVEWRSVMLCH